MKNIFKKVAITITNNNIVYFIDESLYIEFKFIYPNLGNMLWDNEYEKNRKRITLDNI